MLLIHLNMKRIALKSFAFLTIFTLLSLNTALASPWPKPFSDVRVGHETSPTPYWSAINWAYNKGIIQGYSDGTFRPDQCVNRAEFLKLLTEISPLPYVAERATSADIFPDVNSNDWFYTYVGNAVALNWVQGYSDGTFRPANPVNRVEALKMTFWGFNIEQNAPQVSSSWTDINFEAWYFPFFNAGLSKNIIPLAHVPTNLDPKKYFPDGCMTRAEVAELLFRARAMRDHGLQSYTNNLHPF